MELPTRVATVPWLVTAVASVSPDITIVVVGIVGGDIPIVIPANVHRGLGLCRWGKFRPFDHTEHRSGSILSHLHHGSFGQEEGLEGCRFRDLGNHQLIDGSVELCILDDVVYASLAPSYPGLREAESLCTTHLSRRPFRNLGRGSAFLHLCRDSIHTGCRR